MAGFCMILQPLTQINHARQNDNALLGMVLCEGLLRRPLALLEFLPKRNSSSAVTGRGKTFG
jgi:hypothetical protein